MRWTAERIANFEAHLERAGVRYYRFATDPAPGYIIESASVRASMTLHPNETDAEAISGVTYTLDRAYRNAGRET